MAKMQIPLNGSNFISKNRQQSFQEALEDDHQVKNTADPQLTVSPQDPGAKEYHHPVPQSPSGREQAVDTPNLDLVLNHTYNHQQRTLEIHQQYISQQAEYIQLITAVLDQQGKALKQQDGQTAANMIETFQRTLDNFHSLREQGVEIHREFLTQQTAFLEKYLDAIENGNQSARIPSRPSTPSSKKVTEWVVQQPPIVLDDQTQEQAKPLETNNSPGAPLPENEKPEGNLSGISLDELTGGLLEIVAEKTGYPPEMLELDMDLEADLGIDSIKRVEILGSLEEKYPELPPADADVLSQTRTLQEIIEYMGSAAAPNPASPQPDPSVREESEIAQSPPVEADISADHNSEQPTSFPDLTPILLEIVAEKTGYPAEMLELDMDMEADLGIDSIKRVEILGTMEERLPGLPPVPAERLAELRTLEQIVTLMAAATQAPSKTPSQEKKKADQLSLENTAVELVSLPWPDRLEFTIPEDRPLILTDEGTELTPQIRSILEEQGWKTVVWEFPADLVNSSRSNGEVSGPRIKQRAGGAAAIQEALASLRTEHGKPAGFIHLHPLPENDQLFSEQDEGLVKEVFFLASALQEDLTQVNPNSRNLFLSVTRSDGTLGLKAQGNFQAGAGLTGLVKSLNWEWSDVFCRAIDFQRQIQPTDIGQLLTSEIQDPNLAIPEIGISQQKRVTIKRDRGDQ